MGEGLSEKDICLLRGYDTPTVCNVIELFDVRPRNAGYMDKRIRACFPELAPMVGYAVTATFGSASPGTGAKIYDQVRKQLQAFQDVPGPPVVVFQDMDDPPVAATFGEVMCMTYRSFGAAGLVTSGAARDLDQVRALEFPAFSDGSICSHGYCHIGSVQVPVRVGGVTIYPGDLLHGDANGVTTIPGDIASDVAHACKEFAAAEQVVLDYLKGESISVEGLTQARAESAEVMSALKARLARKHSS